MSVIIGFDQGNYEVREGTRQVVLSNLPFKPTIESLMYVFNITQDKTYFAQAQSYAKDITITKEGLNYILEYPDLSMFPVLGANDKIHIQFGRKNNIQYPISVDGDSTYAKDIWMEESDTTNWEDIDGVEEHISIIPFDELHSKISNSTTDNPKVLLIHFNRTIAAHQVGLGCYDTDYNFSNVKIELLGSGDEVRTVVDDSGNSTKYNSRNYEFEPELFNALRLSFYTADTVTISNITIQKAVNTNSFIQIQKPSGTVVNAQGTTRGNFKVSLEEFENAVSVNDNSQLRTTLYDEGGVPARIDDMTETLQIIEYEHHEIHEGNHYNYADYEKALGSGDTVEFVMTTPDTTKWVHLSFKVESSTGADLELFEGTAGVNGGTTIIPRNNNRNSTNTSDVTLVKDPTSITTDGIRAAGFLVGANRNAGSAERNKEFVLKQNTSYLVRITSTASSNNISWDVEWYEHTNAN